MSEVQEKAIIDPPRSFFELGEVIKIIAPSNSDINDSLDLFDDFYDPAVKRANVEPFLSKRGYRLVEGDIRDVPRVEALFRDGRFDAIVHLAARAGVRPSIEQPELYQDVNLRGTTVLLEACRKHDVKKVIFGSSSSVYGKETCCTSVNTWQIYPGMMKTWCL